MLLQFRTMTCCCSVALLGVQAICRMIGTTSCQSLKEQDLSGKLVSFFGLGDSSSFGDTYCDAIGTIYADLQGTGAQFIGQVSTDGYSFDESTAVVDGKFVGLALDEMNESDQTDARIDAWVAQLAGEGVA